MSFPCHFMLDQLDIKQVLFDEEANTTFLYVPQKEKQKIPDHLWGFPMTLSLDLTDTDNIVRRSIHLRAYYLCFGEINYE